MKISAKRIAIGTLLLLVAHGTTAQTTNCDEACLKDIALQYLRDVAKQDPSALPWGERVRYTENNVAMMIGDGFWGAGPSVLADGLLLADTVTGNVAWMGITTEHGQAAYHGLRLKVVNQKITEVESYLGREGEPEVFSKVEQYTRDPSFAEATPESTRRTREQLIGIVEGYFNTKQQNNGELRTTFAEGCEQKTNGLSITDGNHWAAIAAKGCEAQLKAGVFKPVDRIRARRFPVVDETKGVVVALSIEDHATRFVDYTTLDGKPLSVQVEYPNSRGKFDVFKIVDGKIVHIDGVSVFLPYYIHSLWQD